MSPGATDAGRPPESADFAASRVGGPRRKSPIAVLGWVVILGGVVAIGLSGHTGAGGTPGAGLAGTLAAAAAASAEAVPAIAAGPSVRVSEGPRSPRFDPDFPTLPPVDPTKTAAPGPIGLQATRHPASVFVHGDVFAERVTWVFVSLRTLDGQVGGWASVSIPGAADEGRGHRPALRFDVELAVPTGMATRVLLVQANAYNAEGVLIASTGLRLGPEI